MRRIVRLLCIVLTLTLVSCSSVQLAYNNAPSLMQYQLDRYLDLTDEQEKQLRAQLITLQRWHQSAALPIYAATLRKWAHSLSQPGAFSVDDIQAKQKAVQNVVLIFAYEGARALGPVLITLTPRQREYLAARFEESNNKYEKEHLRNPEKNERQRLAQFIQNYERWLGPLNAQQTSVIEQWLNANPNNERTWAKERRSRQHALLKLIDHAEYFDSTQAASLALNQYFESLTTYRHSELQGMRERRLRATAELSAQVLNNMTSEQREHLQNKLLSYASEFDSLADRAATITPLNPSVTRP